jgi:hypothetical protein
MNGKAVALQREKTLHFGGSSHLISADVETTLHNSRSISHVESVGQFG